MAKIDKSFVKKEYLLLAMNCVSNARQLRQEAKILIASKLYPRAFFLSFTALEELAKAILLIKNESSTDKFSNLIKHELKIGEIIKIIEKYHGKKFTESDKEEVKKRIIQMREDTLYTRLKPTPDDKYKPDNLYWRKRAISFSKYLDNYLDGLLEKIEVVLNES